MCVNGFVANVASTLTYYNAKKEGTEGIFIFPVDENSAVYEFQAKIDNVLIVAECMIKEKVLLMNVSNCLLARQSMQCIFPATIQTKKKAFYLNLNDKDNL